MSKELAFGLMKQYRHEMIELHKLHQDSLQRYLAFASAILGVTILGILQIQGMGWLGTVIIVGPIINILICVLAIQMCNRHYLAALERVVLSAKLESVLGLYELTPASDTYQSTAFEFPKDDHFLPERWLVSRKFDTGEEFVLQTMKAGVNRIANWTFYLLIAVNVLLGLAIILIALF